MTAPGRKLCIPHQWIGDCLEGINVYGKGVRIVYRKFCYRWLLSGDKQCLSEDRVYGYEIVPVDGYDRLRTTMPPD